MTPKPSRSGICRSSSTRFGHVARELPRPPRCRSRTRPRRRCRSRRRASRPDVRAPAAGLPPPRSECAFAPSRAPARAPTIGCSACEGQAPPTALRVADHRFVPPWHVPVTCMNGSSRIGGDSSPPFARGSARHGLIGRRAFRIRPRRMFRTVANSLTNGVVTESTVAVVSPFAGDQPNRTSDEPDGHERFVIVRDENFSTKGRPLPSKSGIRADSLLPRGS